MFKLVSRLSSLLSGNNVRYLDVLLGALVNQEGSPIYDLLWNWFSQKFPGHPNARDEAWKSLRSLHRIVRDYRNSKGI